MTHNTITVTPHDVVSTWCVYEHVIPTTSGEQRIFIGLCRTSDLLQMNEARQNAAWTQIVREDTPITINVLFMSVSQREAANMRAKMVLDLNPYCNIHHGRHTFRTEIVCVETGQIFDSVRAAADAAGCVYTQMINHINGKPGHRTVKGKTYTRRELPR